MFCFLFYAFITEQNQRANGPENAHLTQGPGKYLNAMMGLDPVTRFQGHWPFCSGKEDF